MWCPSKTLRGLPRKMDKYVRLMWKESTWLEVSWIAAPLALTPKRGQREVAREFAEPDSEGTVFESSAPLLKLLWEHWEVPCPLGDWPHCLVACPHSKAVSPTKPGSAAQHGREKQMWPRWPNVARQRELRAVMWRTFRLSVSRSSHCCHAFRRFSDVTGFFLMLCPSTSRFTGCW